MTAGTAEIEVGVILLVISAQLATIVLPAYFGTPGSSSAFPWVNLLCSVVALRHTVAANVRLSYAYAWLAFVEVSPPSRGDSGA
jgi:hypothetical protein